MRFLREAVSRISLPRWPWRLDLQVSDGEPERLLITMHVPDRDTGEAIALTGITFEAPPEGLTENQTVAWIFGQLKLHVLHELKEAFLVDGVRVLDPHKDEIL